MVGSLFPYHLQRIPVDEPAVPVAGEAGHQCSRNSLALRKVQYIQKGSIAAECGPEKEAGPTRADTEGRGEELRIGEGEMGVGRPPHEARVAEGNDQVGRIPQDDILPRLVGGTDGPGEVGTQVHPLRDLLLHPLERCPGEEPQSLPSAWGQVRPTVSYFPIYLNAFLPAIRPELTAKPADAPVEPLIA